MTHMQYMPGDPRLVDQLVYELKSKGIFDQFRKDCIADVDTRPAYQNLRQRVENSVSSFLARQCWQPDLNKNQLREKLRKHILDGNYLEQGVERIVDQVVNPKVATVFIPKVEDLVYNYLGITRKKTPAAETSNGKVDLLPTDLEAVSPGSVKSNDDEKESMEIDQNEMIKMDVDEYKAKDDSNAGLDEVKVIKTDDPETSGVSELTIHDYDLSDDKESIPLPAEEIRPEDIPPPENSPQKIELEKIELPKEPDVATDIPLPDEIPKDISEQSFFKPIHSEEDDSSSDSSLRRNMSPLTPIRNFNNENSCDAQQAFESDFSEIKKEEKKEPSSFKFALDSKNSENSAEQAKPESKDTELSYQFNNQVTLNTFATPVYEDSSNSTHLQIDYESDVSRSRVANVMETKSMDTEQNSEDVKKDKLPDEKRSSHKSSHKSRDSHKHSSTRDKKTDSKQSTSSRHDKKSSREDGKHKSSDKDKSKDKNEKKDKESRDSSKHRSSHKSSHRDSKSHRSSSSSHRHSSKHSSDKKSSSTQREKDKSSEKSSTSSRDKSKDSKSSTHTSDKDRKSSSSSSSKSKQDDDKKDKDKKAKKEADDHYSLSGRGNPNRRSTDRDSNDGSSSSKGSHRPSSSKSSESKKETKGNSSKSDNTTSSNSTSPSDKENIVHHLGTNANTLVQNKPIVRVDNALEKARTSVPRLPFVPDITLRKPKIAENFEEAKKIMKMRKFLEEEQRRMNQEAALLLEFQANVRPSLSQVYSSIPGPELEFVCGTSLPQTQYVIENNKSFIESNDNREHPNEIKHETTTKKMIAESESVTKQESVDSIKTEIACIIESIDSIVKDQENVVDTFKSDTSDETIIDNKQIKKNDEIETNDNSKIKIIPVQSIDRGETDNITSHDEIVKSENQINSHSIVDAHDGNINQVNVSVITEEITDIKQDVTKPTDIVPHENFCYFAEHEKFNAELERARFEEFYKNYMARTISNKIYLINCNTYEESVFQEVAKNFGNFEIVNYHRNGHLKLLQTNKIKNVNLMTEVSLPIDIEEKCVSPFLSTEKSDCSFELGSDYDAKLEEMVNKTSRREIMEIILGNIVDESPTKMPKIDYVTESNIASAVDSSLKRKLDVDSTTENNNRSVLTPNKIRRLSTDQISSTTQDSEETIYDNRTSHTRSKYLGRARRVGLPRPKRAELPNSPSSDKSVENYEQNTPTKSNGRVKTQRLGVQRYQTSDLYKPKLHYLSRRNVT